MADLRKALAMLGRDLSRREVARRLHVSHTTINRWLRRIDTALERVSRNAPEAIQAAKHHAANEGHER